MSSIYLLEDNPVISKVLEKYLMKVGYELSVFPRGDLMKEALDASAPDLMICDIMVPGISGLEVARHAKNTPALAKTPIIILTAMTDEKYQREAKEIGVEQYIIKNKLVLSQLASDIAGHLSS